MNWPSRFPLEPYHIQIEFASTLYQALNDGTKLCFMESPTGTGKSYSLLVGLLAWLQQYRFNVEKEAATGDTPMPSWLRKASEVGKQSQADEQQRKQQKKLQKIRATCISSAKSKRLLGAGSGAPKSSNQSEQASDDEPLDVEEQPSTSPGLGKHIVKIDRLEKQEQTLYHRPRVIFTSRTHTQLSQIIQSFGRLKTQLVCCSLASKKHMCIHPGVKKSADVDNYCTRLLDRSKCQYYTKQSYAQLIGTDVAQAVQLGEKNEVCPYFASKQLFEVADVICVPYASIMKRSIRERLGLSLQNSIVVFDEGHNAVEHDLSSRSTQLKYGQLCLLNSRLAAYIDKYSARLKPNSRYTLDHLSSIVVDLLTLMKNKHEKSSGSNPTYTKSSFMEFLLELRTPEIEYNRIRAFSDLNNLSNRLYFITKESGYEASTLQRLLDFFETVIFDKSQDSLVLCKMPVRQQGLHQTALKTLLFEPKCLQEVVQQCRMCVFAGGTLHPLSELEPLQELCDGKFVSREFEHIIPQENCRVMLVERYGSTSLLFNYRNKESKEQLSAVAAILGRAAELESEGIIAFFQSYKYLQTVKQFIKEQPYFERCFFDDKEGAQIFEAYQKEIRLKRPAILFSVMGGRLSEGINFSDQLARRLLIFGLPYSDVKAPEIVQRMSYYDRQKGKLTGRDYYENLCMRTVNQTIGRAIRHREDRALIYLIDERFPAVRSKLSKWLRNRCVAMPNGADMA